MKKQWQLWGLLLISLLLPVVAAACGPIADKVALGDQFMLYAGKSVIITGENLKIKFVTVTSDSRCNYGVECVDPGSAKCLMQMEYANSQTSMTFTQVGRDNITTDFNIYKITYQLQPYPIFGDKIKSGDYRLKMTVKR
jgi:hypothetical protein